MSVVGKSLSVRETYYYTLACCRKVCVCKYCSLLPSIILVHVVSQMGFPRVTW